MIRENIDRRRVEDPTLRLAEKMKNRNHFFQLQPVSEACVLKALKKLKPKKSSGYDGMSQELLKSISSVVALPLHSIINMSIRTGVFPDSWKRSKTIPIFKKGDRMQMSNYRPVACLPAASKVLESVVLSQISSYFEKYNLLPQQQHGFRAGRSTTTAVASMVAEWSAAYEAGQSTGILLWDLSSAFDTIDVKLLCEKLYLYGVMKSSVAWFESFLTKRLQCVQTGNGTSEQETVSIGCPQDSLLSPLLVEETIFCVPEQSLFTTFRNKACLQHSNTRLLGGPLILCTLTYLPHFLSDFDISYIKMLVLTPRAIINEQWYTLVVFKVPFSGKNKNFISSLIVDRF